MKNNELENVCKLIFAEIYLFTGLWEIRQFIWDSYVFQIIIRTLNFAGTYLFTFRIDDSLVRIS